MSERTKYHGTCLCGSVQVTASISTDQIGACHCTMCRRWGGGPLLAVDCADDVHFKGLENIAVFGSSDWAERGFCRACGTHLFYRLKNEGHYAIPVGLFDNGDHWKLTEQIFVDEKPAFYSFREKTTDLTGEEVFARYSNDQGTSQ